MSELIDFATRVIELEGGAVEPHASGIHALVPGSLAAAWGVREELALSSEDGPQRFAYGSELLERMLQSATAAIPAVAVRVEVPPLRANQARNAAEHWVLRNGLVELADVRLAPQVRYWIDAHATLHGDEKRELLVAAVVSAHSRTSVERFIEHALDLRAAPGPLPSVPPGVLERTLECCAFRAELGATSFRESMTRRFERDRARIEGYFEDLARELDKRAAKGRIDPNSVADKRAAMQADRAAKLEALAARFVLRIELAPIALRCVELDGAFVSAKLRRRKAQRVIELEYDALTRKIVPPACDACGGSAARASACDDALHLICDRCAPRAEGRIACPSCRSNARPRQAAGGSVAGAAG